MKKMALAAVLAVFVFGCGAGVSETVAVPDTAMLKTYEIQQKSNTERIERLEKELTETKASLERVQRQSKQLGDSYDALLSLFEEHKKLIVSAMDTLKKVLGEKPAAETEKNQQSK